MTLLLLSGAVGGSVPVEFSNPIAMAVGLVILLGVFVWLKS